MSERYFCAKLRATMDSTIVKTRIRKIMRSVPFSRDNPRRIIGQQKNTIIRYATANHLHGCVVKVECCGMLNMNEANEAKLNTMNTIEM